MSESKQGSTPTVVLPIKVKVSGTLVVRPPEQKKG